MLNPPTGYTYGTVLTTLAVLFRAGKISAKYDGSDLFSYSDNKVKDIFANSRNFQKAQFKFVSKNLSTSQKEIIVKSLLDLKIKEKINIKIDYNTNDFEVIDTIRIFCDNQISTLETLKKTVENFDKLFAETSEFMTSLQNFNGKTTEANYIEKAEYYISNKDVFANAIKYVEKITKFIQKNLKKAIEYHKFIADVDSVYKKASVTSAVFKTNFENFNKLYNNLVDNFPELLELAQNIKDEYYNFMKAGNSEMTELYRNLKSDAEILLSEIKKNYPADLNKENIRKTEYIIDYSKHRIYDDISLDFSIQCKNSGFTLSEIKNNIDLYTQKITDLQNIKNNLINEKPKGTIPKPHKIKFKVPNKKMSVKDYKELLNTQILEINNLEDNEQLEIEF